MKHSLYFAVAFTSCVLLTSVTGQGQTTFDAETQAKILKGFQIAPVPLNMVGRDASLVGLGSYIVNANGDCNGCHSAGAQTTFLPGKNPYFGQATQINPATYLGGGDDFGAFPDPTGNFPHIVSRNLTPDKTGKPLGGDSLQDFMTIIRTGVDPDKLHPTCAGPPDGKCIPPPFNGNLLQIMPWPAYGQMTDRDLQAIYEYLSAIPCVEDAGKTGRCTPGISTAASASPKNTTILTRQFQLDGTKSTNGTAGSLTYAWSIPQGSPSAAIFAANSANPTVQIGQGRGLYTFQLTVTDASGKSATDFATVNFQGN